MSLFYTNNAKSFPSVLLPCLWFLSYRQCMYSIYTYTLFYFCICTSPIADFYVLYISSCSLYSRGDVLFHLKRFYPKRAVRGRKYIYILFDKIHDTPLNPTEGRPSKLCLHNISLQTFCIVLKWTVYVVRTRVFKAYSSLFWTQLRPECTRTDRYWNFEILDVLHCGFFFNAKSNGPHDFVSTRDVHLHNILLLCSRFISRFHFIRSNYKSYKVIRW